MFMYTEGARYWWEKHRVRVGPGPRISTFLGFGLGPGLEFQVFSGSGPGPGLKKRVPAAPYLRGDKVVWVKRVPFEGGMRKCYFFYD